MPTGALETAGVAAGAAAVDFAGVVEGVAAAGAFEAVAGAAAAADFFEPVFFGVALSALADPVAEAVAG